jgi:hypothetical protein
MPGGQEQAQLQGEPLSEATCESPSHLHFTRHNYHRSFSSVGGDKPAYVEIKCNERITIRTEGHLPAFLLFYGCFKKRFTMLFQMLLCGNVKNTIVKLF